VSRLPGFNHPIEPMQLEADTAQAYNVRVVGVDADFFALMNARVVAGRPFGAADFESEADAVIVDASWARDNLPGRNPIGQRIRFPRRDDRAATRWHEIVGVVDGMRRAIGPGERVGVYAPLRTGKHAQLQLYLRTTPPPATLVPAVEAGVASVSPTLAIEELKPLDAIWRPVRKSDMFFLAMLNVVGLSILLFALAGIYALMSFTVAQRAREIAIRAALGANPRRIIAALFSRAIAQIALGVVAGAAVVSLTVMRSAEGAVLVGGVAALMTVVGLAGCFVPALRAVRIQPTKALKAE
jgi:hypothetical protein